MKRLLRILTFLFVFVLASSVLVACVDMDENTVIGGITQERISMQVFVTSDKIRVELNSVESEVGNATVKVAAVKAYEYIEGEQQLYGLSADKLSASDESTFIGDYKLGTESVVEISRYVDGFDRLYCKYYVVHDGKVLRGPIYATQIDPVSAAVPQFDIKSKKGILGENLDYYKDLNCSYTAINLDITDFIYPNELIDEDGEEIPLAHPDDAYAFASNGKTFYFRKSKVDAYDNNVRGYYSAGAHITGIIYATNNNISEQSETFPAKMTYLPWATMAVSGQGVPPLVGLNTSNRYGFEYFVAMMEFFAERYSLNGLPNGYIANFVIGNEIDYARDYNRISEKHASLDVYMEEYSRLLRLSNLSLKKYHKDITVCMPITQSWANRGYSELDDRVSSYAPKAMVEWLNVKTKLEGDYDWGIAPHCYTYGLALSEVFYNDTINGKKPISAITGLGGGMTNDFETSGKITFSNIELIDQFLKQDKMKVNGKTRNVYLTEQGVSSFDDDEQDKNNQAGCIAAIWYKLSQLDTVKAFCYYRLFDHKNELAGHTRFGLLDINREPKPAYELYKYIDTQYSDVVSKDFLQYVRYVDTDGKEQSYANGGVKSYMDLLDVFGTNWFDGEFDWDKATPVKADIVYEYEDVVDLSQIKFDSANFLYDGTEKRIEAFNLPDGVEVSYSQPPVLTEVGTKEIIATFTKNGNVVGRRSATITVGKLSTNKTVYNFRENIYVTVDIKTENLSGGAWVGIYKKGAIPGNTDQGQISYMYFYINQRGDSFTRTYCLQEQISNKLYSVCIDCGAFNSRLNDKCVNCRGESFEEYLPSGDYVIYYFNDSGYEYVYSVEVTVLPSFKNSGTVDLSGVGFEDCTIMYDGEAHELLITGKLPNGVSVSYFNNTLTEIGKVEAIAVFSDADGVELERRYAVLTVTESDIKPLSTDKTTYTEGEDVFVKAFAPADSLPSSWWVGLYLADDAVDGDYSSVGSIYYYYVKDDNHLSGIAYDIRKQIANINRLEYFNLPAGDYKFVLFNTSGYDVEETVYFTVNELVVDMSATLELDANKYDLNAPIMATATQPEGSLITYYVGLFKSANEVSLENALYMYKVEDANHVSGESYDLLAQTAMSESSTLRAGSYKVVLFAGYGYAVKIVKQLDIQLGTDDEQPTIGTIFTDKDVYVSGESVYVTAYAPEGEGWWIGLYPVSQTDIAAVPSVRWYYAVDATHASGGTYDIMAEARTPNSPNDLPVLTEGVYKVVLFNSSGYTIESQFEFRVVSAAE